VVKNVLILTTVYHVSQKIKASMQPKYREWMNRWCLDNDPYGKCAEATLEMQKVFPELIRVRGHYFDAIWGERQHWWLIDNGGEIIDPTCGQFPTKGGGEYKPWNEGSIEPTGLCPNCGEYCFHNKTCCSSKCDTEYAAYLNRNSLNRVFYNNNQRSKHV